MATESAPQGLVERIEALANTLRAEAHGRRQHHDSDGWSVLNEAAESVNGIAQQVAQQQQVPEEMRKQVLALAALRAGIGARLCFDGWVLDVPKLGPERHLQVLAIDAYTLEHKADIDWQDALAALAAAAEALGLQPVPLQQSPPSDMVMVRREIVIKALPVLQDCANGCGGSLSKASRQTLATLAADLNAPTEEANDVI